jgi:hypothetical protein
VALGRSLIAAALIPLSTFLTAACGGSSSKSQRQGSAAHSTGPPVPAVTAPASVSSRLRDYVAHLARLDREVLNSYVARSGPRDPRYWRDGTFVASDGPPCWFCYDTASTAAAVLSRSGRGDTALRSIAIETLNRAIRTYQRPDGEFAPDGIATGFFTVELGISYLELRPFLSPNSRGRWIASVRRAADWLIATGQTTFYINGNVNLRQTEIMWLAWVITGDEAFRTAYEKEWDFTIAPAARRWAAFGLKLTRAPGRSDGSDGAGYLAESDGGSPGFDPSYTMAQLDTASELYVLTRDPRYLRLMNLLFNQERPRISADFTLNATGGARKSYLTPFTSSAPFLLALSGVRPNLTEFALGEIHAIDSEYQTAMNYTQVNAYKGLSGWLALPVLAVEWPQGMAAHGSGQP